MKTSLGLTGPPHCQRWKTLWDYSLSPRYYLLIKWSINKANVQFCWIYSVNIHCLIGWRKSMTFLFSFSHQLWWMGQLFIGWMFSKCIDAFNLIISICKSSRPVYVFHNIRVEMILFETLYLVQVFKLQKMDIFIKVETLLFEILYASFNSFSIHQHTIESCSYANDQYCRH